MTLGGFSYKSLIQVNFQTSVEYLSMETKVLGKYGELIPNSFDIFVHILTILSMHLKYLN